MVPITFLAPFVLFRAASDSLATLFFPKLDSIYLQAGSLLRSANQTLLEESAPARVLTCCILHLSQCKTVAKIMALCPFSSVSHALKDHVIKHAAHSCCLHLPGALGCWICWLRPRKRISLDCLYRRYLSGIWCQPKYARQAAPTPFCLHLCL